MEVRPGVNNTAPQLRAHKSIEASDYPVATTGRRAITFFLDGLISLPLGLGLGFLLKMLGVPLPEILNNIIMLLAYWVVPTTMTGQTLGKRLMGLRVVSVSGEDIGFFRILMRESVGRLISTIFLFLGYIWSFFREDRRAWHDLMVGSKVLDIR